MNQKIIITLFFVLLSGLILSAQSFDDEGNPNDPHSNERANACYAGGSMENKCDTVWEWNCAWYLIRFEAGILSREDFPTQCSSLLPALPENETVPVVTGPPRMSVGCYDSSSGDFDFYFNGPINQYHNAVVNTTTNGACTGFNFDATIVYFEGSQADALLFCQSLNAGITYIENSQSRGYPVPNAYFWGCA